MLGSRLAFVTGGHGDAVLFVHGNPTSSFLWRRVLPGLTGSARCVAVDLIGMGRSGKPDISYGFADHAAYLEAFADLLGLRDVTVVGHDWGAVLGLDLLRRRPDVVGRIAVCEGHLHPFGRFADMGPGAGELFARLRTPGLAEQLVLQENFFIEQVLPGGMTRPLSAAEHDAYRAPFRLRETGSRCCAGSSRSRWTVTPPTWTRSSGAIRTRCCALRCPGCCCMASPAPWSARPRWTGAAARARPWRS